MGQITVTAEAPAVEAVDLEVMTAEEIKAVNARTVAEALVFIPGVRISIGRKNEPNLAIGAFDQSKILVLIDGVPYYETNYGKLDLNQISTDNIARIEVSKGAASVLYGANAMGGVVNIVTKRANDRSFTGATVEIGESSTRRLAVSHGMSHGKLSYWMSFSHMESDGWDVSGDFEPYQGSIVTRGPSSTTAATLQGEGRRTSSDYEREDAWLKIGWENSDDSAFWINLHYLDMTKGLPPATDEVRVFLFRPAFSHIGRMPDYRDSGIDLDMRQRLSDRLVLKSKLFYHGHQDHYDSYGDLSYSERLARSTFKDYLAGGSAIVEARLADWSTLRLAVNYRKDSHRERDDTYLPFAETQSYTGSIGVEEELRLSDDLRLVLGVSHDWFDVSSAERNILGDDGNLKNQDPLETPSSSFANPMVGLSYTVGDTGELFASAGRKTRFPLLSQLYSTRSGNIELDPERSTNVVVGYRSTASSGLRLKLSGFWYEISDLITRSSTGPSNIYQNYAEVRMRGIELGASTTIFDSLVLRADITYNDAEDQSRGRVTTDVVNVAELIGGIGLKWRLPGAPAALDLNIRYLDDVFTSLPSPRYPDDPVEQVSGYLLTDIRFGYDLTPKLEVWATVRNLLDESYESEYAYPGPGRAISFGLSGKL
jgi:iron complex outermembrane receptor protein